MQPLSLLTVLATICAAATIPAANTQPNSLEPANVVAEHFVEPVIDVLPEIRSCGVDLSTATVHFNNTLKSLHQASLSTGRRRLNTRSPLFPSQDYNPASIGPIETYIHIISSTAKNNTVTPAMVAAQMAELSAVYNTYGIFFFLAGTTWTVNDAWAIATAPDMKILKAALRQGPYSTLNLYFHTDLTGGILGTCTLPAPVTKLMPRALYSSDGCNMNARTMPGGGLRGYNMGKTAVHETGHWLGLLHTFEGYSCSGNGDFVSDTLPESASTNGCPSSPWKQSCPFLSAGDPIHNYMDYSTDACYEQFTPQQVLRMQQMWAQYRQGL